MRIKRAPKKCHKCGDMARIHCEAVMVNGCSAYFCYMCWHDHVKDHDEAWKLLTEVEKRTILGEFKG